ncbi:MAG: DUF2855 family protein [Deltaproteobacteria bacterium]|nr:DUF2855 family protein [Deltaproteobacteria bacterium]
MPTTAQTNDAAFDFLVSRADLHQTRLAPAPAASSIRLQPGQVLLAVDTFAFTANNITYAVFGEAMGYWDFFPAPRGEGRVPVWGFAEVAASAHPVIEPGERIFGYFPMSTYLLVDASDVNAAGFSDAAAHRAHLHPLYNYYTRCSADPGYDAGREAEQMIFRPLFMTAFLIDDFLADNRFFGAKQVLLTSASSKTAISLAFQLHANRGAECEIVGLTSPANIAFVEGLGCYHRVVTYGDIASLSASIPAALVDMAGNGGVVRAVHSHFGDRLKYSCMVGGTHWDRISQEQQLCGPAPVLFFAPAQMAKRAQDWGAAGLQRRIGDAWAKFLGPVSGSMRVVRGRGPAAVQHVYCEVLDGRADPSHGQVLSLHE